MKKVKAKQEKSIQKKRSSQTKQPSVKEIRLSATIITYNEEKNIERCIASVHGWCDEVIVLDSFSNDNTEKIARGFPKVKFFTHKFDGHVQQKNRAVDYANGKWIFCLDADEEATSELAESVLNFIKANVGTQAKGARVRRLTFHLGKAIRYSGWYTARYRLLYKGEGAWGGENPHDEIFLYGTSSNTYIRRGTVLAGDLLHYSFTDLSHQIDTINKFSSIVAFSRHGKHKRASWLSLFIKPTVKFIEVYIFKLAFLDGWAGYVIAQASAFSSFLKIAKLMEMRRTPLERPSNVRADYKVQ